MKQSRWQALPSSRDSRTHGLHLFIHTHPRPEPFVAHHTQYIHNISIQHAPSSLSAQLRARSGCSQRRSDRPTKFQSASRRSDASCITHHLGIGAAYSVRAALAAAADAHDADGRAREADEAREVAEHDAEQAREEVALRGGALRARSVCGIDAWGVRAYGDGGVAALDAAGAARAGRLAHLERSGDRKKGEGEERGDGELHGAEASC